MADAESAKEYYPQRIEGVATDANGRRCYQVKWHYYTDISLEPIERVQNEPAFQDILDRYFAAGTSTTAAQKTGSNAAKQKQAQAGSAAKKKNTQLQPGNAGKKKQAQMAGKLRKKNLSVRSSSNHRLESSARTTWSAQEDNELMRLVARDGTGDWDQKAKELNSRRKNDL